MNSFYKKITHLAQTLIFLIIANFTLANEPRFQEFSMNQLKKNISPKARLFAVIPEANSLTEYNALLIDENAQIETMPENIVIITHGWNEQTIWFFQLAAAITYKTDNIQWTSFFCDWRKSSRILNPIEAAQIAKDKIAPAITKSFPPQITKNLQHVHLIGHSAGSWAVSQAAKYFANTTNASLHITLLDAYVPPFWKENELAQLTCSKNRKCYTEQYFTRDLTLYATEVKLTNAHNVDITKIDPTIPDHEFPYHWYTATVINKYFPETFYAGKKLYFTSPVGTRYGYQRSKQASTQNWEKSLTLKKANKPVTLTKDSQIPIKSLAEYFKTYFSENP